VSRVERGTLGGGQLRVALVAQHQHGQPDHAGREQRHDVPGRADRAEFAPFHLGRHRRILDQAATHFAAGELRVVVGATFPLADAADAHRALEAGQVTGKAVLTMS
jgi:NADPH:quinone reductase-like Zn-dependent oxidoreductase